MTLNSSGENGVNSIAITPRSTLTQSGSTLQGPILGSKRLFKKIFAFD